MVFDQKDGSRLAAQELLNTEQNTIKNEYESNQADYQSAYGSQNKSLARRSSAKAVTDNLSNNKRVSDVSSSMSGDKTSKTSRVLAMYDFNP